MQITRPIYYDWSDGSGLGFITRPWTPGRVDDHGRPIEWYHIFIDRVTGKVTCDCMDAKCRHHYAHVIPTPTDQPCKHINQLLSSIDRILREGLEVAINA